MTNKPSLRRAEAKDSERLFAWVNSPDSLSVKALTKKPIAKSKHEAWYAQRLGDAGTMLYMIELSGIPVGQVRLQKNTAGAYGVDIYVERGYRGQGLAAWAIHGVIHKLSQKQPKALLVALVRLENKASAALFQHTGFTEVDRSDEFITFERKATS